MDTLLSNYRVLDFGRYIAAPYCASLLGQMGADVIRIERPGGSEDRYLAPVTKAGDGAMYLQMNTNKRGMTLDISHTKGREITRNLIATADIVIANMPPKTLEALALDYASLKKVKKEIILVANTAFGSKGPYANHIGFDGIAQAVSGANYFSGLPGQPMRYAVNYVDFSTAISAAMGTLAALMHKEKTGDGQIVETSLLNTALSLFNSMLIEQAVTHINRVPTGNMGQLSGPSNLFPTKDGHVIILVVGPYMFKRWLRLMDKLEWLGDERFQDDVARGNNNLILCEEMTKWTSQRTTDEALLEMKAAKLPAGPVLSIQEALDHPMVHASGHLKPIPYPGMAQDAPIAQMPFTLSQTAQNPLKRAPTLGEHTEQILEELGFGQADIVRWIDEDII